MTDQSDNIRPRGPQGEGAPSGGTVARASEPLRKDVVPSVGPDEKGDGRAAADAFSAPKVINEDISTQVLLSAPRRTTMEGGAGAKKSVGGQNHRAEDEPEPSGRKTKSADAPTPDSGVVQAAGSAEDSTGYSGSVEGLSGSDTHDDLLGTILDKRYRIVRLIGEGGMGRVYQAEHVGLGRKVAVKVLHPMYSNDVEVVERFRREARAASAIGHPSIVDVTDTGTTQDGRAFFVMEYLDGVELADVIIDQGTLDAYRAAHIGVQVCRALAAAHKAGIIHRDLKPENVFLVDQEGQADFVKVLDFGIAKSTHLEMSRGGGLTQPGFAMGTPEYMAPEQAAGLSADPRVDIYAVGGILYAMLAGRPPHQGRNVMETLNKKATEDVKPIREYRLDVPEELDRIVMWCLERKPDDRPASMEQLEYELRKFLSGRPAAVAALLGLGTAPRMGSSFDTAAADSAAMAAFEPPPGEKTTEILEEEQPWEKPTEVLEEEQPWEQNTEILDEKGDSGLPGGSGLPAVPGGSERALALSKMPTEQISEESISGPAPGALADQPAPSVIADLSSPSLTVSAGDLPDEPSAWSEGRTSHTVVTAPPSSHGWVVALLTFLVVAGLVAGWLLWRLHRADDSASSSSAAAGVAGAMSDASVSGPDASSLPPDASVDGAVFRDAARPHLSKKQFKRLASKAWRAARRGRWTRPAHDNLLSYLTTIDAARPGSRTAALLRRFARKKLLRRATIYLRRKDLARAESALRDLLALAPNDRDVTKTLSNVLLLRARKLRKSKPSLASTLAGEAVVMKGGDPSARLVWADALVADDKPAQALAEYQKVASARKISKSKRRRAQKEIARLKKIVQDKAKARPADSASAGRARESRHPAPRGKAGAARPSHRSKARSRSSS